MLTNSRDIKRRLESEGWMLERVTGSHHVFKHPTNRDTIILPHPKRTWEEALFAPSISRQNGSLTESARQCVTILRSSKMPARRRLSGFGFPIFPAAFQPAMTSTKRYATPRKPSRFTPSR
jgi:predicted RNA binding protein YcfA (HicA-like mRNA interferase family)